MGHRQHLSTRLAAVATVVAAMTAPAHAAYQILHHFGSTFTGNPGHPRGSLIKSGPLLYGMTWEGGSFSRGVLFQFDTTTNTATTLHNFGSTNNGSYPYGHLVQSGTNLYGMTSGSTVTGVNTGGTLFRYNTATSTFNVLHHFSNGSPRGSPMLSGNFIYGLTRTGGTAGLGVLFQYNLTSNAYTVLHNFTGTSGDGATPLGSVIASDSTLYGLTSDGGTSNRGTIFRYDTSNQSYAVVHSFAGGANDGDEPRGSLLLHEGKLYGTTFYGGADFSGTIFSYDPATDSQEIVHDFGTTFTDGEHPHGSLISVGGRLYGMTQDGGQYYLNSFNGTVFEFDPLTGSETVLHSFGGPGDGEVAIGSLYFDDDVFYGMTQYGGSTDSGIIFSLDLPEPSAGIAFLALGIISLTRRRAARPQAAVQ